MAHIVPELNRFPANFTFCHNTVLPLYALILSDVIFCIFPADGDKNNDYMIENNQVGNLNMLIYFCKHFMIIFANFVYGHKLPIFSSIVAS